MANIVEVKLKIEREKMGAFVDKLEKLTAQQTFDRLTVAAGFLEGQVRIEMRSSGMVLDRSAHRRKKGATRIINSFRGRVDGTPNRFPIRLILEPKPGVSHKKVASLEKGTKGHTMPPPQRFPGPQRYNKAGAPIGRIVGEPKFRNAYAKNNFTTKDPVNVGSRPGFHFMEDAIKETIRAMKQGRV